MRGASKDSEQGRMSRVPSRHSGYCTGPVRDCQFLFHLGNLQISRATVSQGTVGTPLCQRMRNRVNSLVTLCTALSQTSYVVGGITCFTAAGNAFSKLFRVSRIWPATGSWTHSARKPTRGPLGFEASQ